LPRFDVPYPRPEPCFEVRSSKTPGRGWLVTPRPGPVAFYDVTWFKSVKLNRVSCFVHSAGAKCHKAVRSSAVDPLAAAARGVRFCLGSRFEGLESSLEAADPRDLVTTCLVSFQGCKSGFKVADPRHDLGDCVCVCVCVRRTRSRRRVQHGRGSRRSLRGGREAQRRPQPFGRRRAGCRGRRRDPSSHQRFVNRHGRRSPRSPRGGLSKPEVAERARFNLLHYEVR
jgi:hypothetical protein